MWWISLFLPLWYLRPLPPTSSFEEPSSPALSPHHRGRKALASPIISRGGGGGEYFVQSEYSSFLAIGIGSEIGTWPNMGQSEPTNVCDFGMICFLLGSNCKLISAWFCWQLLHHFVESLPKKETDAKESREVEKIQDGERVKTWPETLDLAIDLKVTSVDRHPFGAKTRFIWVSVCHWPPWRPQLKRVKAHRVVAPPHLPPLGNLTERCSSQSPKLWRQGGNRLRRTTLRNELRYIDEVLAETLAKIVQKCRFAGVRVQQHKILHPDLVPGGQRAFHVQTDVPPPHFLFLQETEQASAAHLFCFFVLFCTSNVETARC